MKNPTQSQYAPSQNGKSWWCGVWRPKWKVWMMMWCLEKKNFTRDLQANHKRDLYLQATKMTIITLSSTTTEILSNLISTKSTSQSSSSANLDSVLPKPLLDQLTLALSPKLSLDSPAIPSTEIESDRKECRVDTKLLTEVASWARAGGKGEQFDQLGEYNWFFRWESQRKGDVCIRYWGMCIHSRFNKNQRRDFERIWGEGPPSWRPMAES